MLVLHILPVQQSGKIRDRAIKVSGSVTLRFLVGLMVPCVPPVIHVKRKHFLMPLGSGTLEGKAEAQLFPTVIQALHVQVL